MKWQAKRGRDYRQEKYAEAEKDRTCPDCDGDGMTAVIVGTIYGKMGGCEPDERWSRCETCHGEGVV